MSLTKLLEQERFHPDLWKNIITGNVFFEALLGEDKSSDWRKIGTLMKKWSKVFELRRGRDLEEKDFQEKCAQWEHADKLIACAEFAACLESDQLTELLSEEKKGLRIELDKYLANQNERLSESRGLQNDEIIALCWIFLEKKLSPEVRRIPFVTAPKKQGEEGRVHILELRKSEIYGLTIQNPSIFPFVYYISKIHLDFKRAIEKALSFNVKTWKEEKTELQNQIDNLRNSSDDADKELLPELQKSLKDMTTMGRIERYGIIWEVKPFHAEHTGKEFEEFEKPEGSSLSEGVSGESIGLAAAVGIYFALRDKYPDERVLYSAKLNTDTNQFSKVDGIAEKIKAALKTNFIDTFVMHKDNFDENVRKIIDSNLNRGKSLRVKTIDPDGNERQTYPHSEGKLFSLNDF